MTVGDRIRQVRQEQDVTQQELADYIGVSKQAVYKYENNIVTNIPTDKVDAIAKRLKVSPAYLMGWEEQPTPKPTSPSPIPRVHACPSEESPSSARSRAATPTALQNREGDVDVPEDVRCDFALKCHGDSMVGAGIHDGDVVYIHIQPDVENGEIAAVRIGDEATLKRVYLHTDYIELRPENPAFESIIRRKEDMNDVHIEGKAVGYTHWF